MRSQIKPRNYELRKLADGRWQASFGGRSKAFPARKNAATWAQKQEASQTLHKLPFDQTLLTHEQVGKVLGISRQRVYQIEMQALLKLRNGLMDDPEFWFVIDEIGFKMEDI